MTPLVYDRKRKALPKRVRVLLPTASKREARAMRAKLDQLLASDTLDIFDALADQRLSVRHVCREVESRGVEEAVTQLRHELRMLARKRVPTLRQAADQYLEDYAERRQPHTVRGKTTMLRQLLSTGLGERLITEVGRRDIRRAVQEVGGAESTKEALRIALSGLFTWLVETEAERARRNGRRPLIEDNPAREVERWEQAPRVETASREQVTALLAHADLYQRTYLRLFLHLGLRISELIHLRYHLDLDPETWELRVQARPVDARCGCPDDQYGEGPGWSPKTKRSDRLLLVPEKPARLREIVEDYLTLRPRESGDYVLTNPRTGRLWTRSSLYRDLRLLCEAAGVKYGRDVAGGLTPHTLRHTCATEMVRAGVRESVVAGILGDTVETISRVYVHLTAEDLADGIARTPEYGP